jgi:hypothetical protein
MDRYFRIFGSDRRNIALYHDLQGFNWRICVRAKLISANRRIDSMFPLRHRKSRRRNNGQFSKSKTGEEIKEGEVFAVGVILRFCFCRHIRLIWAFRFVVYLFFRFVSFLKNEKSCSALLSIISSPTTIKIPLAGPATNQTIIN